jgi:hypothetical protein
MIKMTWKMNGRTVRPNQIADELMKGVHQGVSRQIQDAVRSVTCPVHGQRATNVRPIPGPGKKMNVQYEACCEELKAAIARRLM